MGDTVIRKTRQEWRFPAFGVPQAARLVRRLAARELALWGVPPDRADLAIVVLNELAANAIVHSPGRLIWISMVRTRSALLLQVADQCMLPPVQRDVAETDESGRGLHLIKYLTEADGHRYHRDPNGAMWKVVWARMDIGQVRA
ncbi:ATP-binding protein [Actinomadura macrotermitis]|uniref:Histidine kinase/HSP90-like ATPase domain-containing protein n=1 Tax=Actinomadura macrotermitis TaxID=2585200 RepID=A0A7K0C388_9ACTN|nr:ATP-binding protein [Actinomadura macrotermitis]MQY07284.1 hypothetical protein [Actinomadura macrotermitis]